MAKFSATVMLIRGACRPVWKSIFSIGVFFFLASIPVLAQVQTASTIGSSRDTLPDSPTPKFFIEEQGETPGVVRGIILDSAGTAVTGAHVKLTHADNSLPSEVISAEDGSFVFADVKPGAFRVDIELSGFAPKQISGALHPAETLVLPTITLVIRTAATQVRVEVTEEEIAQEQIRDQEKQRVAGFIPNFYVSYVPDAVPLRTKQKFHLAYKDSIDPVVFLFAALLAGAEQATDQYPGFGQGASGFAKRFGAAYGDFAIGTFVSDAIFPSILKQDPRYFYKGTGTAGARARYALKSTVFCRDDNRKWVFCSSVILGSLVSGAISNAYYPEADRGAGLVFRNAGLGLAATAGVNLLQEFVLKKLTKNAPNNPNSGSNATP